MAIHRRSIHLLLIVVVLAGLSGLTYHLLPEKAQLELRGELHHLWAGPVNGRCMLTLTTFNAVTEGAPGTRAVTLAVTVLDGKFSTSLPYDLFGEERQWIELAVWCSELDAKPSVLQPPIALDPYAPDPAQAGASTWLCAVPHDAEHGEITLRSATLTLYATFLRTS